MSWGGFRYAAVVVVAWTLVALAWTPPTVLISGSYGGAALTPLQVFANVLCSFIPWMTVTPLIVWLGRRHPISEGRAALPLAIHFGAGLVVVPVVTALGVILGRMTIEGFGMGQVLTMNLLGAVMITAFYSVPTYVAVVAVGQALGYFERYRLRERLLARAELRALKAQLNPHFLFNTLNAVSALGYRDARRADEALTKLAAILRSALEERPETIPLKDEIAFAQDYLDLYAVLLPGKVRFVVDVEPESWTAAVPAMLLQPLIENALLHGAAGDLTLAARRDGERLSLALRNAAPREADTKGSGIGLANARERLRVLFGDAARLDIVRGPEDAAVSIMLPFSEAEA